MMKQVIAASIGFLSVVSLGISKGIEPAYTVQELQKDFDRLSISRYQHNITSFLNSVLSTEPSKEDDTFDDIVFGLSMILDYHGEDALRVIAMRNILLSPQEMRSLVYKLASRNINYKKVIKDFFDSQ